MIQHLAKVLLGVVLIFVLSSSPLHSQDSTATLTGSVTDSAGKALPNVKISVKNLATGESIGAQTDSTGRYSLSNLAAGDYEVSVETNGAAASTQKVTLAATPTTLNFTLSHEEQNLPNAPSPSKTAPSLEDLGFSASESQAGATSLRPLREPTEHAECWVPPGLSPRSQRKFSAKSAVSF
jgi:Carboxypeptidase regulatory-like domain